MIRITDKNNNRSKWLVVAMKEGKMINFTVGPVMSKPNILEVAHHSAPYFRTPEFSDIMLENEKMMLSFLNAPIGSRNVFLTTSGTGGMESCVMNILNDNDKIIVINGGSFGQRFVELCELHNKSFTEVKCGFGEQLKKEQLEGLESHTALLVNMDETSSGILYDMNLISTFCKKNNILLIIDAISAFITDDLNMSDLGADVVIVGSQKALAVQAGVVSLTLSPNAIERIQKNKEKCLYLSLKAALKNMERGQTPYTPAVTTLLQINSRLKGIEQTGGIKNEREKIVSLTNYFRNKIKQYPFEFVVKDEKNRSNAVTALHPITCSASRIVAILKDEYNIWVCPNGGTLSDYVFRVGHIGWLFESDYDVLFKAFDDMKNRNII